METLKAQSTINDVIQTAREAKQQIWVEGSFDVEFDNLNAIVQKAQQNIITPEQAIKQIQDVLNTRQNYH